MFNIFKKSKPQEQKQYKFLSSSEASKIAKEFIASSEYDEGTLRLIRYIEKGIEYNASHGFNTYRYENEMGFPFIKYKFNEKLLKKHFKDKGYFIYMTKGSISSSGFYCEIKIEWWE